ncbi:MAG: hypothetical protein JSW67_02545 [Candidatus Latescibacterota bacterium]|nr:MAG: hypothetical protein JSW67_02545 [Candidatus Latescibacterota bacterium]
MGLWTAVVLIVAIGVLSEMYRARLKAQAGRTNAAYEDLAKRLVRLEDRMANIETIVLEQEKAKRFAELHAEGKPS